MIMPSILLIDDDDDVLQVIGERCRQMGLHVRCARNLLTAVALVERQVPDLMCVDVRLPTGNGLSFCETLTDGLGVTHIPTIALTGLSDAATIQACRRVGARHVLKRPDVWTELRPLIERLLHREDADAEHLQSAAERSSGQGVVSPDQTSTSHQVQAPSTRTIVVADDDADMVDLLTDRFTRLGCQVIGVGSAFEALDATRRTRPDMVCIDVNMPAGNGLSVCEMMASDERLRGTPTVVLTGKTDRETVARCHDLMVYYVEKGGDIWSRIEPLARELLELGEERPAAQPAGSPRQDMHCAAPSDRDARPVAKPREAAVTPVAPITQAALEATSSPSDRSGPADETLLEAVFAMLGGHGEDEWGGSPDDDQDATTAAKDSADEPPWVLCIDDDPDFSMALKCRLESCGVAVIRAYGGMEGYRLAFTRPASAILLDYNLPDGQGDYILGRLQDNPVTQSIPVILVTGMSDPTLRRRMLNMGAKAFFTKPVDFPRLRDALAQHIGILAAPVG